MADRMTCPGQSLLSVSRPHRVSIYSKNILPMSLIMVATILAVVSEGCPIKCDCSVSQNATSISCVNKNLTKIPAKLSLEQASYFHLETEIDNLENQMVNWNFTTLHLLDLSFNELTVIQEHDFQDQQQLTILSLQNNQIDEIKWGSMHNLTSLLALDLSENLLSSLDNYTLFGLVSLKTLNLSKNQISELENATFSSLPVLEILDLSYNSITKLVYSAFVGLSYLKALNLSHNSIVSVDSFTFLSLQNLEVLEIFANDIRCLDSSTLTGMKRIRHLDISRNSLVNITDNVFEANTKLERLILDRNPLEEISNSLLRNQEHLVFLSISHMQNLYYLSPNVFEHLTSLKTLNLGSNPKLSFISGDVFNALKSLQQLDLSNNNLSVLSDLLKNREGLSLDIGGNAFVCDCLIEWMIHVIELNDSAVDIHNKYNLTCTYPQTRKSYAIYRVNGKNLQCNNVSIVNFTKSEQVKVGSSVILHCEIEGEPHASITWVTPKKQKLTYHNFHQYAIQHLFHPHHVLDEKFHASHMWHDSNSYDSEIKNHPKRITILQDGSLFIDYVLRSDAGRYTCIAKTPHDETSQKIDLTLDCAIFDVKIMSIIVGAGCAATFFTLNLIYALISAAARRCINQRRREAISQIIENMYQYKSTQVGRIRENYNSQVNKIRDQYHFQLTRLRSNYTRQKVRIKDGCSHQLEKIRENYTTQTGKLKDYTSHQLDQLRDKYNSQLFKMRDYGSSQLEKIRKKYKLKQQHVFKLLETMNIENCRTIIDTDCVRAESILMETGFNDDKTDLSDSTPNESASDLEYVTASSSEPSSCSSQENMQQVGEVTDDSESAIDMEDDISYGLVTYKEEKLPESLVVDIAPIIDEIQMIDENDDYINETVI